jgi:hypothetical protein
MKAINAGFAPTPARRVPNPFRYVVLNIVVITALLWAGGYLLALSLISLWPF